MAKRKSAPPPKGKGESLDANKRRARNGWGPESIDDPMVVLLLSGDDDARESVFDGINNLAPERRAAFRNNLKSAIEQARTRGQSKQYIGWLLTALTVVADDDSAAIDSVAQELSNSEGNEWARYWVLAQLYWTKGVKEAAKRAADAESLSDSSLLVRTLAQAIMRRESGLPSNVAITPGTPTAFAELRALQIVDSPSHVPQLVELMFTQPGDDWVYETLLTLTATPELADVAADYLAKTKRPLDILLDTIISATTQASRRVIRRIGRLLWQYPRPELEAAVRKADESRGAFSTIAHEFLGTAPGDTPGTYPPTDLAPGLWRAELAYRSVLQRPSTFDLLESLSPVQLAAVLERAGMSTADTPVDRLREQVQTIAVGGPPNPLWLAWIRTVHANRLTQN
jgi:hypothetical protein